MNSSSEKGNKGLIAVFCALLVTIVGLAAVNIVTYFHKNSLAGVEDSIVTVGKTPSEVVAEYQSRIDATRDKAKKAELYEGRIDYVMNNMGRNEAKELLISDSGAVYDILQDGASALVALNIALSYDEKDLADKYEKIVFGDNEMNVVEESGGQ